MLDGNNKDGSSWQKDENHISSKIIDLNQNNVFK